MNLCTSLTSETAGRAHPLPIKAIVHVLIRTELYINIGLKSSITY